MRISEVLKSLAGGCAVYLFAMACSSSGDDGNGPNGTDTGGVTGMNGNAGETGSGAAAMAATGGSETGQVCDCPVPEAPVTFERDCSTTVGAQKYAVLNVTDMSMVDKARIVPLASTGEALVGWPAGTTQFLTTLAITADSVVGTCAGTGTPKVTFVVPADLAGSVQ